MSYTKHYQLGYVEYSGSVDYPASDNGGSASYSGSVPVELNVTVDTESFDESVNGTKIALTGVAGAITAMEAAQCAAIHETGVNVSTTAIKGFYHVINSEISQQITECNSAVRSKFVLMLEQSKSVSAMHDQMDGDFHRIKSRYEVVFKNLDDECHKRIVALDQRAFQLAEKVRTDLIQGPFTTDASFSYSQISDDAVSKMQITLARLRKKVAGVIDVFSDSAHKSLEYKKNIEHILYKNTADASVAMYLPIVYAAEDDIETAGTKKTVCFKQTSSRNEAMDSVVKKTLESASTDKWQHSANEEADLIDKSFMMMAEKMMADGSEKSNRIYKQIVGMWQKNKPQTMTLHA